MTKINVLCMQRKVAEDMCKSVKSEKEKEAYRREIERIETKICVMVEYD